MTEFSSRSAAVEWSGLSPATERAELNGAPVQADDLRALALLNYGHFTSMMVEDGHVRGLDRHLARLEHASRELFGYPLDTKRVRGYLHRIVAHRAGLLRLRVTVFSRQFHSERPARPCMSDVLVTLSPAREPDRSPIRLKSFRFERALPHVKHVGTFALFHYRRRAQLDGFDDALFVDSTGAVSEASVWNIGFFDGHGIVWPNAPALNGVSMQLLQQGLRERGVASESRRIARAHIGTYRLAFLTNSSCPVRPIATIDDVEYDLNYNLVAMLEECYAACGWHAI